MDTEWDLVDGYIYCVIRLPHDLDMHCKLAALCCVNVSHIANFHVDVVWMWKTSTFICGCLGSVVIRVCNVALYLGLTTPFP